MTTIVRDGHLIQTVKQKQRPRCGNSTATMLNTTILSTIQNLSPLWARQISEKLALGSEYTMLFSAIITEIAKYINICEEYTIYASVVCGIAIALNQIGMLPMPSIGKNIFDVEWLQKLGLLTLGGKTTETVNVIWGLEQTNKMLRLHPEYFVGKPSWTVQKTGFAVEPIIYDGNKEYVTNGIEYYDLTTGTYKICIDKTLMFDITVSAKPSNGNYNYTFTFYKGTMKQLDDHVRANYMEDRTKSLYYNRTAGSTRVKIQLDKQEHALTLKGNPQVWNGFFHVDLPKIVKWVDAMNETSTATVYGRMNQLKHMGIICHGPPGTGKSTLTRIVAQYTGRHIMSIRIQDEKTLVGLYDKFYSPRPDHFRICNPNECVFELEEFDKAVLTLIKLKETQERRNNEMFGSMYNRYKQPYGMGGSGGYGYGPGYGSDSDDDCAGVGKNEKDADGKPKAEKTEQEKDTKKKAKEACEEKKKEREAKNPFNGYDWSLDDLLTLLCGSIRHDRMIIIATCNDFESIRSLCPALFRPGRLTPILFNNGDGAMLIEIVNKYCSIEITADEIPTGYLFQQAALIEFLLSQHETMSKEKILAELPRFQTVSAQSDIVDTVATVATVATKQPKQPRDTSQTVERVEPIEPIEPIATTQTEAIVEPVVTATAKTVEHSTASAANGIIAKTVASVEPATPAASTKPLTCETFIGSGFHEDV